MVNASPKPVRNIDLANAIGVKPPSVSDYLSGKTKSMVGENLLKASQFLKVNPLWLSTGKGEMRPSGSLPGANDKSIQGDAPVHPTMDRLYQATNLSAEQIATDLNITNEIVQLWEADGIPNSAAIKAALKYKFSLEWLQKGVGTQDIASNGLFKKEEKEKTPKSRGRWVPVKAYSRMGNDGYFMDMYGEGNGGDGYIPSLSAGPRAYVVKGTGDSMFPAIRNGWYVVCDPDEPLTPTEFVQVCLKDGRCTIKEFIGINNDVLSLIAVNGGERLSFNMDEVDSIAAITDIVPPSRHRQEYPFMPIKDIEIDED